MRKFYALFLLPVLLTAFNGFGQGRIFGNPTPNGQIISNLPRVTVPNNYSQRSVDFAALNGMLSSAPAEASRTQAPIVELPMPDGRMERFRLWESSIMEAPLQAKFPEIRTYAGQGVDDPAATVRLSVSPYTGLHAQVLSPRGNVFIDPYARGDRANIISYYRGDLQRSAPFLCEVPEDAGTGQRIEAACRGIQLYTYRLAVACTGEYAIAVGGTTAAALHAAIVTTVNRVNGVYEKELAIRLVLVANNDLIEFRDPATDPFNGNNSAGTLIGESQTNITSIIGTANFDIGHTFSTGGGGLAGLGVVCNPTNKARGITGSGNPVGDAYDIDYVAHEIGHQFGGAHTFNSTTSSCNGNRSGSTAYEVGSGTTIQAYAGICGSDNIQPNSDPYFHPISFDQISNFVEAGGASCRQVTATGNTLPVITAMNNNGASIPLNTPFTLTGTATDADGDALTYSWEEFDLGPSTAWNAGNNNTSSPLFKSRVPKTTGSRTFPDIAVILANYPTNPAATMGGLKGETLPTTARTMNFRFTVRDNRAGGGGVVSGGSGCSPGMTGAFQITTVAGTGPFVVSAPNGGESYAGGSTQTVTWNVAGTAAAPINCTEVRLLLSTDGGLTYPTVLLASTANDGSEAVTIPAVASTTARVKVEAIGNVFFDISNANFTITAPQPGFDFNTPAAATVTCGTANSPAVTLGTISNLGFATPVTLTASGNPAGTTVLITPNTVTPGNTAQVILQNMGSLAVGNYSVTITGTAGAIVRTRVINFNVTPGAGPVITAAPQSLGVCDGGTATFSVVSSSAVNSYQWQLSTDGGTVWTNLANANDDNLSVSGVTPAQNGYQFRVLLAGPCNTTTSAVATLSVFTPPSVSLASTRTSVTPGESATVTATVTPGSSTDLDVVWTVGSTVIPNVNNNSVVVGVGNLGDYQVTVTDGNGCSATSSILSISAAASSRLFIFPNPNDGRFVVTYYNSAGASGRQTITIYDSKGARVYNRSFTLTDAYTLHPIDIFTAGAARGVYYIVVGDNAGKKLAEGKVLVR